ncbi:MAG: hypothetical protein GYA57_13840 [Myxococcales bacterium]|nr:hypothetical protein [Myxococcales bacterium]
MRVIAHHHEPVNTSSCSGCQLAFGGAVRKDALLAALLERHAADVEAVVARSFVQLTDPAVPLERGLRGLIEGLGAVHDADPKLTRAVSAQAPPVPRLDVAARKHEELWVERVEALLRGRPDVRPGDRGVMARVLLEVTEAFPRSRAGIGSCYGGEDAVDRAALVERVPQLGLLSAVVRPEQPAAEAETAALDLMVPHPERGADHRRKLALERAELAHHDRTREREGGPLQACEVVRQCVLRHRVGVHVEKRQPRPVRQRVGPHRVAAAPVDVRVAGRVGLPRVAPPAGALETVGARLPDRAIGIQPDRHQTAGVVRAGLVRQDGRPPHRVGICRLLPVGRHGHVVRAAVRRRDHAGAQGERVRRGLVRRLVLQLVGEDRRSEIRPDPRDQAVDEVGHVAPLGLDVTGMHVPRIPTLEVRIGTLVTDRVVVVVVGDVMQDRHHVDVMPRGPLDEVGHRVQIGAVQAPRAPRPADPLAAEPLPRLDEHAHGVVAVALHGRERRFHGDRIVGGRTKRRVDAVGPRPADADVVVAARDEVGPRVRAPETAGNPLGDLDPRQRCDVGDARARKAGPRTVRKATGPRRRSPVRGPVAIVVQTVARLFHGHAGVVDRVPVAALADHLGNLVRNPFAVLPEDRVVAATVDLCRTPLVRGLGDGVGVERRRPDPIGARSGQQRERNESDTVRHRDDHGLPICLQGGGASMKKDLAAPRDDRAGPCRSGGGRVGSSVWRRVCRNPPTSFLPPKEEARGGVAPSSVPVRTARHRSYSRWSTAVSSSASVCWIRRAPARGAGPRRRARRPRTGRPAPPPARRDPKGPERGGASPGRDGRAGPGARRRAHGSAPRRARWPAASRCPRGPGHRGSRSRAPPRPPRGAAQWPRSRPAEQAVRTLNELLRPVG